MDRHSSEIWATVRRYGAGEFAHMESDTQAATYFIIRDRWIQLLLAMPAPKAAELTKTETGADRSASAVETAREPACRSRWQARALIIEAQFEVVEVGIVVFEDEPLANTVPPGASIAFGEVLPENMRLAREKTALDRSAV